MGTRTASKMQNAALTQRLRTLERDGAAAALQDAYREEEQRGNGWGGFPDHELSHRGKEGVRGDGAAGGRDAGSRLLDDPLASLARPCSGGVSLSPPLSLSLSLSVSLICFPLLPLSLSPALLLS